MESNIKRGEELRYDYDLSSYSKSDLPEWYLKPDSDSEDHESESENEQPEQLVSVTKLKRCMVPDCGVTVVKIWNHIHGVHKNLSGE